MKKLRKILAEEGLLKLAASTNITDGTYRGAKFDIHVFDVARNSPQSKQYTLMKGVPLSTVLSFGRKYAPAILSSDVDALKRMGIRDSWSAYDSTQEWEEDGVGMEIPVARLAGETGRIDDRGATAWVTDYDGLWVHWEDWG